MKLAQHTLAPRVRTRRTSSAGYALIEALVGILVFSLGILGIIAMHAKVMKISADSRYRTEAAVMVDELVAQMAVADPTTVATDFATSGSKTVAWINNRVKAAGVGLPQGNATVTFTQNTDANVVAAYTKYNVYLATITVTWSAPGMNTSDAKSGYGTGASNYMSYTTQVQVNFN